MRSSLWTVIIVSAVSALAAPALAQTIYPIDRAEILVGARFDFKVEFPGVVAPDKIEVTVNDTNYADVFGAKGDVSAREDGRDQSALLLRDVALNKAGTYRVSVSDGTTSREIAWTVYDTGPRKAKNVILFIGDGMAPAHRVAARLLSKGIAEGNARGKLAIDDMPAMALVSDAGADSIITDSANSASAYATGHKSSVNAMGVYADRTADPLDDPKVETISSLVKRRLNMAVGIVTNTEIEDATPAAMFAHTRRRAEYDRIVEQMFAVKPDVIMGGGLANFLPKSATGSRRKDEQDFVAKFSDAGYRMVTTASELRDARQAGAQKLLGLFNLGNMDGVLDRKFLKGGSVKRFQDQPDLTEEVDAALTLLSARPEGFFLMVESGLIDKYTHVLDMERAVYDTLILVVPDHNHPISLIGTIDDDMTKTPEPDAAMRDRVKIYEKAGFPDYPKPDAEGYPERVDVDRRLAIFSASHPDYYETFRPKLDNPNKPTMPGAQPGTFTATEQYKDVPGAILRRGNLPLLADQSVHSGEDVILTAAGPGSERVHGSMENTDVFRVMTEALGLGAGE
jgi:alkaline phosphatase